MIEKKYKEKPDLGGSYLTFDPETTCYEIIKAVNGLEQRVDALDQQIFCHRDKFRADIDNLKELTELIKKNQPDAFRKLFLQGTHPDNERPQDGKKYSPTPILDMLGRRSGKTTLLKQMVAEKADNQVEADKVFGDMKTYGIGLMLDGKHVPTESVFSGVEPRTEQSTETQQTQPEQPEPCPSCGCSAVVTRARGDKFYVECRNEECMMNGPLKPTRVRATSAWNFLVRTFNLGMQSSIIEAKCDNALKEAAVFETQLAYTAAERDELAGIAGIVRNIVVQFNNQPPFAKRTMDAGVTNAIGAAGKWVEAQKRGRG